VDVPFEGPPPSPPAYLWREFPPFPPTPGLLTSVTPPSFFFLLDLNRRESLLSSVSLEVVAPLPLLWCPRLSKLHPSFFSSVYRGRFCSSFPILTTSVPWFVPQDVMLPSKHRHSVPNSEFSSPGGSNWLSCTEFAPPVPAQAPTT